MNEELLEEFVERNEQLFHVESDKTTETFEFYEPFN